MMDASLRAHACSLHLHSPGRLIDFMRQADEPGLINLAAGVPSLESLPTAQLGESFQRAFAEDGAAIFGYHHPEGDRELRELLAARLRTRDADVSGAQLFTVTGCQQGLQLLLDVLAQPGDIVACEVPAYYALLELIAVRGCRVLPLPVRGPEGFDLAEVETLLAAWKPKCLFVCTTLANPSGATLPESKRGPLVEICRRHGVRVIEDDIYAELVETGAPKPLRAFDDGSTVSYVSSFSKSVSPGLRVGVCVPGTIYEETCGEESAAGHAQLRRVRSCAALFPAKRRARSAPRCDCARATSAAAPSPRKPSLARSPRARRSGRRPAAT
jgi:DNA-binding transcriptional MocR family regulator